MGLCNRLANRLCRVYPLSLAETKAMEEYVQEALQQGFILPSTSSALAGFFLMAKKEGVHIRASTREVSIPSPPSTVTPVGAGRHFVYNLINIREENSLQHDVWAL